MFLLPKKARLFLLIFILLPDISTGQDIYKDLKRILCDLQNASTPKRTEAIKELVAMGKPAAGPLILNLNHADGNVRNGIIEALGKIRDERAIEPLINIIGTELGSVGNMIVAARGSHIDMTEIEAARTALINIGEPVIEPLFNCIMSPKPSDHKNAWGEAVRVLGKMGKPAVKPLIDCLNHTNPGLRQASAYALGSIGDVKAVGPLIRCLQDPDTQNAAIVALGMIKDSRAIEALTPYLFLKRQGTSRLAAEALEKLGYKPENLEEQIYLKCAKWQWSELSDLGPSAAEILMKRLNDSDAHIRLLSALALGHMKDTRAIKPLEAFWNSPDDDIRGSALTALVKTNSKTLIPFFAAHLANKERARRRDAVIALKALNYQPQTEEEQIKYFIAGENINELTKYGSKSVKPLLDCLKEESSSIRRMALEALLKIGEINAAEPFLLCLHDEDGNVRQQAVWALEMLNYRPTAKEDELIIFITKNRSVEEWKKIGMEYVDALIHCLDHEASAISSSAAQRLGEIGDKRAVEPLIRCLQRENPSLRESAVRALGILKDKRAVEPLLERLDNNRHFLGTEAELELEHLIRQDRNFLETIANSLAKIGDQRAIKPLLAYIENRQAPYPSRVVYALEQLGYKPSTPEMQASFEISKHYNVPGESYFYDASPFGAAAIKPLLGILNQREFSNFGSLPTGGMGPFAPLEPAPDKVIDSLINVGKPVIGPLISSLKDSKAPARKDILTVLGKIGDDSATETLISFCLTDPDWRIRQEAALSLGKMGDEKAVDALIACLHQELDGQARKSAAESLGNIKKAKAIEPLEICLSDPDKNVRQAAAVALDTIGHNRASDEIHIRTLISKMQWYDLAEIGAPAVEPLIPYLKDNSPEIRQGAAEALGKTGNHKATAPLIPCLSDNWTKVREAAAEALGRIGDAQAMRPLAERLKKEEDSKVRGKIIEALTKFGDDTVVPDLAECLPDWFNRSAIRSALTKFGWKPATQEQNVYWYIASREKQWLDSNQALVKRVLMSDANSADTKKFEHSVYAVLELGYDEQIPELANILRRQGTRAMAETIQNCDNKELAGAAEGVIRRITRMLEPR
jgi:HEAT repeat protein